VIHHYLILLLNAIFDFLPDEIVSTLITSLFCFFRYEIVVILLCGYIFGSQHLNL